MTTVALMAFAAFVIGYAKTAVGGMAVISVTIFASLLPARESTAAILMVLIVGDILAVWHYRHDADWTLIRALVPSILPGLALGAGFLALVNDATLRRSIGLFILVMVALQFLVNMRRPAVVRGGPHGRLGAAAAGLGSGFATMTANSAGAVMTLYLLAKGVEKRRFVGTSAWFFFGINVAKLPFSAGLGLLHPADVWRALALAPAVALGSWLGVHTMRRISQRGFEWFVAIASGCSALVLIHG